MILRLATENESALTVQAGHGLQFKPGTWFTVFMVISVPVSDWPDGLLLFIKDAE